MKKYLLLILVLLASTACKITNEHMEGIILTEFPGKILARTESRGAIMTALVCSKESGNLIVVRADKSFVLFWGPSVKALTSVANKEEYCGCQAY